MRSLKFNERGASSSVQRLSMSSPETVANCGLMRRGAMQAPSLSGPRRRRLLAAEVAAPCCLASALLAFARWKDWSNQKVEVEFSALHRRGQARSGSMWVVRIAFFLMASLLADAFMPSASMPKLTPPCRVVASNREPRVAAWRMGSAPGDSETSRHVLVIAGGVENTAGRLLVEKLLRAGEKVSVISDNPGFTRGLSPSSARLFLGNPGRVAAAGGGQLLDTADDSTVVRFRDVVSRADTIVVAEHASNFPSPSWLLGASPRDMTAKCENIAAALERNTAGRVSKVVLLSSLGAARGLPKTPKLDANILFWVLNFWGALDAAGASEATLRQAAERSGAKFTIVRGKQHCYLKGPWGGLDEASFSEMGYAGVRVWAGDVGDGETSDGALAEALLHAAALPQADGRDITVVNARGTAPPQQASEWAALFAAL